MTAPDSECRDAPFRQMRVILDVDAKNGADGQFAVVYGLLSPGLEVRAVIASHDAASFCTDSMERSYDEIVSLLDMLGRETMLAYPGQRGPCDAQISNGVQKIITEAMEQGKAPLYFLCLGAATNVTKALTECPEIAGRMTVIWTGGGPYPLGGWEQNLVADRNAANILFHSGVTLWQVPENVSCMIRVSIPEIKHKARAWGKTGQSLCRLLEQEALCRESARHCGECLTLNACAALGVLFCGETLSHDLIPAPWVNGDFDYNKGIGHMIWVYREIDSRFVLEDLFAKLALYSGRHKRSFARGKP